MLKRDLTSLNDWFSSTPRKPLVLRGARQVGKSTLVRQFAAANGLNLVEINLEKHAGLDSIFQTLNIEKILLSIDATTHKSSDGPKTLLFLDEIQATPHALAALRYFFEERPDLPIIAAGSLLEFVLADHTFSMPVGRIEYLWLYPFTFKEFLIARNKEALVSHLESFSEKSYWPPPRHQELLDELRWYQIIGGMPEVVQAFVSGAKELRIQKIQDNIVATYSDDFSKYASGAELSRLQQTYRRLAQFCGRKVKYAEVLPGERSDYAKATIDLLAKAGIIHRVFHSSCDGLPIRAGLNPKIYKVYWLDTGLLNRMHGMNWKTWMDDDKIVYEGPLAEQFVAQELIAALATSDPAPLCYWLREGKSTNGEVDFVIQEGSHIIPIEVKSGASGKLKSLANFIDQKKLKMALKLSANEPSVHEVKLTLAQGGEKIPVFYRLNERPIYMAGFITKIVNHE